MKINKLIPFKLLPKATSIQRKILFGMVSISLVVITFISIVVATNIGNFIAENNIKDSTRNISNIENKLDLVFQMAETNAKSIASNTKIQEIIDQNHDTYKYTSFINRNIIKNEIINVIGANNIIDAAVIYDLNGNIFSSGVEITDNLSVPTIPKTMAWIGVRNNIYRSYNINLPADNLYVVTLRTPIYSYLTGKLIGCLELYIPEPHILNLYNLENVGKSSSIFILNNQGYLQSASTHTKVLNTFNEYINFAADNKGYLINRDNNTLLVYKQEPKMGWHIFEETQLSYFFKTKNEVIGLITIIGILGLICSIFLSLLISKGITRPLYHLTEATKSIRHGNLNTELQILSEDEIGTLTREFNKMLVSQNDLINRLVAEETQKKEYALELIQDQVKPHFLYNTLDNLCALAELDRKEELVTTIWNLSNFYRGVLSKGESLITIKQEVSILTSYLQILHVRYKDKFTYNLEWDQKLGNFLCPKLILQPIVENAIYHGVKLRKRVGYITISIFDQEDLIVFSIKDDGVGMTPEQVHNIFNKKAYSFGVKSTDERVKLYYGEIYGLNIDSSPGNGTIVTIKIPKTLTD